MVLLETKSTIPKSSKFLEDLYNKTLEYEAERTGGEKASYEDCKNKHSLWGMDKLVTEFRKLFVNKTAFMSLYSEYDSVSKKFGSDLAAGYPYKPTINQKSQKLDVFLSLLSSGSLMIPLSWRHNISMRITWQKPLNLLKKEAQSQRTVSKRSMIILNISRRNKKQTRSIELEKYFLRCIEGSYNEFYTRRKWKIARLDLS